MPKHRKHRSPASCNLNEQRSSLCWVPAAPPHFRMDLSRWHLGRQLQRAEQWLPEIGCEGALGWGAWLSGVYTGVLFCCCCCCSRRTNWVFRTDTFNSLSIKPHSNRSSEIKAMLKITKKKKKEKTNALINSARNNPWGETESADHLREDRHFKGSLSVILRTWSRSLCLSSPSTGGSFQFLNYEKI